MIDLLTASATELARRIRTGEVTSRVVVDAQPAPTSKDQCKKGGWTEFGFKNQGQCVSYFNHL